MDNTAGDHSEFSLISKKREYFQSAIIKSSNTLHLLHMIFKLREKLFVKKISTLLEIEKRNTKTRLKF